MTKIQISQKTGQEGLVIELFLLFIQGLFFS